MGSTEEGKIVDKLQAIEKFRCTNIAADYICLSYKLSELLNANRQLKRYRMINNICLHSILSVPPLDAKKDFKFLMHFVSPTLTQKTLTVVSQCTPRRNPVQKFEQGTPLQLLTASVQQLRFLKGQFVLTVPRELKHKPVTIRNAT